MDAGARDSRVVTNGGGRPPPSRRTVLKGLGLTAGTAVAAGVAAPRASAAARTPAPVTGVTIASDVLQVTLDPAFPAVLGYTWTASGAVMGGQPGGAGRVTTVRVNGSTYTPAVTVQPATDSAVYTLTSGNLSITVSISVSEATVTWAVTSLRLGQGQVKTFAVPGLALLSAGSDEGGQFADLLLISQYGAPQAEQFRAVADMAANGHVYPATYGVLNTATLAGAVYTTIIGDNRLAYSTAPDPTDTTAQRTGLGPNTWTVTLPNGAAVALPTATVAITDDANGDGVVDWQDGAIALRSLYQPPYGFEAVRTQVVQGNVKNYASTASQPFLTTLDEIKRCYLFTDGLPQALVLKGYQSEGHDSGHPDYSGHYNTRAGGLADLSTLVGHAQRYNATIGVHINDVISFPEAHAFRWDRTPLGDSRGRTDVLDLSWAIDSPTDLASGMFAGRIDALLTDLPDLAVIYSDAFRMGGVPSYEMAQAINSRHVAFWTEYNPFGEAYAPATYNGGLGTGLASTLLRFVANAYRDAWTTDPLLLGLSTLNYQGWTGETDMTAWLASTYTNNLPTKYMQHQQILTTGDTRVTFTGNLVADNSSGTLQLTQDGALIVDGSTIFLPWSPGDPDRIYHWNDTGGTTTWTLPPSVGAPTSLTQYELTDNGRVRIAALPVTDGSVTVTAQAATPYVLYWDPPPVLTTVSFGAEQRVIDPSFNTRTLAHWSPSGSGLEVTDDGNGMPYARIGGSGAGSLHQRIKTLAGPHTYSVSVWVRVTGTRTARLRVTGVGPDVEVYTDSSPLPDILADSRRAGTTFQRMKVYVDVPEDGARPVVSLLADATTAASPNATVDFADIRVVQNDGAGSFGTHAFTETFEYVDQGWGPFLYTGADGDHVHLSELNQGYTRDTITGQFSLKCRDDTEGLVYRTLPQTLRLLPGRAYHVGFAHQTDPGAGYHFVVGSDDDADSDPSSPYAVDDTVPHTVTGLIEAAPSPDGEYPTGWTDRLPPVSSAPSQHYDQTFSTGDSAHVYLGVVRDAGHAFVLDQLVVDDLGPCPEPLGPLLTVDVSPLVLAPGDSGAVTVTLTNTATSGLTNIVTSFALPTGWTASGTPAFGASLDPGAVQSQTVTLTAPSDALRDAAPVVRLTATAACGAVAVRTSGATDVTVPFPSFAAAANQAAIVRDAFPFEGNFTDAFFSLSTEALTAVGAFPGAALTGAGAGLSMPQYGPGLYDNVCGTGATISLTGTGTNVSLLVSGVATARNAYIVLTYTDGTSTASTANVPIWTAGTNPPGGAKTVVTTAYRDTQYGPSPYDAPGPYCLYRIDVPLDTTRTLYAVTLPVNANVRTFGVFVT